MAADTKDAPAKAPLKGFSLRSRLLGIPAGGKPETEPLLAARQPRDAPPAQSEAEPDAVSAAEAESPQAPVVEKASEPAAPKPASSNDDEHDDDNDEGPRVGIALTPRRSSLLSVAFGFGGERK